MRRAMARFAPVEITAELRRLMSAPPPDTYTALREFAWALEDLAPLIDRGVAELIGATLHRLLAGDPVTPANDSAERDAGWTATLLLTAMMPSLDAVDQLRWLVQMPVGIPLYTHLLRHAKPLSATEVERSLRSATVAWTLAQPTDAWPRHALVMTLLFIGTRSSEYTESAQQALAALLASSDPDIALRAAAPASRANTKALDIALLARRAAPESPFVGVKDRIAREAIEDAFLRQPQVRVTLSWTLEEVAWLAANGDPKAVRLLDAELLAMISREGDGERPRASEEPEAPTTSTIGETAANSWWQWPPIRSIPGFVERHRSAVADWLARFTTGQVRDPRAQTSWLNVLLAKAMLTQIRRLRAGLTAPLALAIVAGQAAAQPPVPTPPARAWAAIREADLRRDLFAMAAPSMRGREGGTIDELRASIWVAEQYAKLGLQPMGEGGTWFQWFTAVRTRVSVGGSTAAIAGRPVALWQELVPMNVVPVDASGPVLWVADPADTTIDVRGRIVATVVQPPAPGSVRATSYPTRVRVAEAAMATTVRSLVRRGPAAVLVVAADSVEAAFDAVAVQRERGVYDVDRATPRGFGQSDRVAPLPAAGQGPPPTFLVRAALGAALRGGAPVSLSIRLERFEVPSVNVIGGIRGTDPKLRDEWVLYSSHQDANGVRALDAGDSVLAGADDNASVSVAEFAVARALVAARPKRSVLWVHHGAEERGLLGSRYHSAHPVVPIERIVTVLNGDMIGRNHPDTAALLGAQPPHRGSAELVQWALAANARTSRFVIDTLWDRPTHPEGWFFRSDHLPYARLGVPSLMYTTNLHGDYHTAQDVPERIDYPKLTRMARWMYLTGWYAANAPRRPKVDEGYRLERE
jgi:hypothetical protein